MARAADQSRLFDSGLSLPNGFIYRPDFLSVREEEELIAEIERIPLENAPFREYTALRRVMNFGWGFEFDSDTPREGPPLPPFLQPLQRKVAKWIDAPVGTVVEALVTEYQPGTPIGWHRDRDVFETTVGISLAGWCDMKLRPMPAAGKPGRHDSIDTAKERAADILTIPLEPRSAIR
jgi:alkylated DNA repair dioxygenase AlkB